MPWRLWIRKNIGFKQDGSYYKHCIGCREKKDIKRRKSDNDNDNDKYLYFDIKKKSLR